MKLANCDAFNLAEDGEGAAFKPYLVIYRVASNQVIIYLIVDGRRDLQSVPARRLLSA